MNSQQNFSSSGNSSSSSSRINNNTVNDQGIQRMIDNNAAMHYSNQMVLAESMTHCPINTLKAYSSKQFEWREWCRKRGFGDGEIVTDSKLSFFLADFVSKRGRKLRKNEDGSPIPLGKESVLGYVKAVSNLCATQKALGMNPNGVARGPLVKTHLDTLEKQRVQSKRQNFEDRGKNTLNDGYTKVELEKVCHYFLTEKNSPLGSRDRLCFLLSHAMLCRSQTVIGMQFADLFSLEIENQGVSRCLSLVATMTFGKTNQHGKIEYGSSIRHRDVQVCSVGALAMNLFSRFHFENEPFPDFTRRDTWYETCVVKGQTPFTPIEYTTQHKIYRKAFKKVGIHTTKVTHANRKSALNMIAQEDVSGDQQRRVGRWGTDRMVGCYVSSLPVEAMKSLAGFSGRNENYFLPRAVVKPPMDLQVLVFPDIEFWQEKFKNGDNNIQEDIAGPNFLQLLSELRVVFLQDSVALKRKYPEHYLWNCSLFETDLYKQFEEQVLSALQEEERVFNTSQLVQRAMPELVSTVEAGFGLMAASMQSMRTSHSSELQKLNKRLFDFFDMGRKHFSQNQGSSTMASASTSAYNSSDSSTVLNSENLAEFSNPPSNHSMQYLLNRTLESVTDVWREYSCGLGGHPSVEHLEKEYGTTWRKERKESRFFSRRKEIYTAIQKKAVLERTSCEEAARRIEERRVQLGISLDKLRFLLKEDMNSSTD